MEVWATLRNPNMAAIDLLQVCGFFFGHDQLGRKSDCRLQFF